ncbi:J-type chaperone JAC1 [Sporobolomyces salmoneus]|uniref:J-type chaperone JAC1 n=1 Tax=Sporobolomyces salmoneus TaxID=183962 RepID=UPI00316EAB65
MQSALRTATTSARPITRLNGATVSRFLSTSRLLSSPLKSSTPSSATCPSCHVPLSPSQLSPLCPSCSTLVPPPPSTTTHYSLFSLPTPSYAIDLKALKREFLKLQQKVHPDRFGGQGEREEWAKLWSSRVNEAWKTLSNERERAEYLLSLHDVTIGEADPVTDPELLMSIMEIREALEEAETPEQVDSIRAQNSQEMQAAISSLVKAFDQTEPPDLEGARNLVIQLKYLDNIETVCREWSPGKRVEIQH